MREELNEHRARLDPVVLLRSIKEAQPVLATMSSAAPRDDAHGESLERFLARLPVCDSRENPGRPTRSKSVHPGNRNYHAVRLCCRIAQRAKAPRGWQLFLVWWI